jgi:hypothetical protein
MPQSLIYSWPTNSLDRKDRKDHPDLPDKIRAAMATNATTPAKFLIE